MITVLKTKKMHKLELAFVHLTSTLCLDSSHSIEITAPSATFWSCSFLTRVTGGSGEENKAVVTERLKSKTLIVITLDQSRQSLVFIEVFRISVDTPGAGKLLNPFC